MSSEHQTVGFYSRAFRNWWWILVLVAGTTTAAAAFFTARQERVYRAAATVTVTPSPEIENPTEIMRSLETLERRTVIATFASVAEARETRDASAALLGLVPSDLRGYRIRASVVPRTNIIRVSVEGRDGERVAAVANAVAEILGERARATYRIFSLRPLEAAVTARGPIRPEPRRNLLIAAVVGVFAGMLLGVALESLRPASRAVSVDRRSEATALAQYTHHEQPETAYP